MGRCCSKPPQQRPQAPIPTKASTSAVWHFKSQANTNKLIVFDSQHQTFWELELSLPFEFQQNQLLCRVSSDSLLVVGGKDDGRASMFIDLPSKTGRKVTAPPIPVEHGSLHLVGQVCYAVGCVTLNNGKDMPAPVLSFDLQTYKWNFLPPMPIQVLYPGSFISSSGLHVLGGFVQSGELLTGSKCIQTYYFSTQTWAVSHLTAPLSNGFPMCAALNDSAVIVVGGHDPSETIQEAREVYFFDWKAFSPMTGLPEVGALCFKEPPLVTQKAIYAISEDDVLFTYSLETSTWTSVDIEDRLHDSTISAGPAVPRRQPGDFIYHYDPDGLVLTEHDVVTHTSRKTEPSSFQYFYKDPGIAVLSDGRIMFAGGKLQGELKEKVWVFDPVTRLSRPYPDLPNKQYGLRLAIKGNSIFALAGCDFKTLNEPDYKNHCQVLQAETWHVLPSPRHPTKFPAVSALGQCIYCIGGKTKMEFELSYNLIQRLHVLSVQWELLKVEYPLGVYKLGVVALPSNYLLCFGGLFSNGMPVSETFLFDSNSFSQGPPLAHGLTEEPVDTKFTDWPVVRENIVYAFSQRGVLHKYTGSAWDIVPPSYRLSS